MARKTTLFNGVLRMVGVMVGDSFVDEYFAVSVYKAA
jgi:hypothetical protein